MTESASFNATRRGLLKSGALGLGTMTGALALGGVSASAASADTLTPEVLASALTSGPVDYFLRIDGIDGDSVDDQHPKWIDVGSWSFGASAPATSSTTTGTTGKSTVSNLNVSAESGSASPKLFLATMTGQRANVAMIDGVRNAGDTRQSVIEIRLGDVGVTSYQVSASEWPFDSFALSFSRITVTFRVPSPDGGVGTAVSAGWDLKAGRPL